MAPKMPPMGTRSSNPLSNSPSDPTSFPAGKTKGKTVKFCEVDVYKDIPKSAWEILKPKINFKNHPIFGNSDQVTPAMKAEAKSARRKGYQYLANGKKKIEAAQRQMAALKDTAPNESQKKQIENLYQEAAKEFQKAFPELVKALMGGQNPQDHELLLDTAFLAAKVGEIPLAQELYRVYLAQNPCDHDVRAARLEIGQALLQGLTSNLDKIPAGKKQEVLKFFKQTQSQVTLDGGLLMAVQGEALMEKISENLRGFAKASSEDQKKSLEAAMPYIQQLMKVAQAVSSEETLTKTFPNGPEAKVKSTLQTLMAVTAGSQDKSLQNYHDAFSLYYHSRFGDQAKAVALCKSITQKGYKELGAGDAKKGREKVDSMVESVKQADTAEKQLDALKKVAELPPAFVEAHMFLLQVEHFQEVRTQGLLKVGDGDENKGRVTMNGFVKKGHALEKEVRDLQAEVKKLRDDGKTSEADTKEETLRKKMTDGEKLAKEISQKFSSEEEYQNFLVAYTLLDNFEQMEQKTVNQKVFAVWDAYNEDVKDKAMNDGTMNFIEGVGEFFSWGLAYIPQGIRNLTGTDRTRFQRISDEFLLDLDLQMAASSLIRRDEARTVSKALEILKDQGLEDHPKVEESKEHADELLKKDDEEFSLALVLEYGSTHRPSADAGKKLLEHAKKLKEDPEMKRTAVAIERLVAETCPDPAVVKVALEQLGEAAKQAA